MIDKNDDEHIDSLGLSVGVRNALFRAGIRTVSDLKQRSDKELLLLDGLGRQGLLEVTLAIRGSVGFASDVDFARALVAAAEQVAGMARRVVRLYQNIDMAVSVRQRQRIPSALRHLFGEQEALRNVEMLRLRIEGNTLRQIAERYGLSPARVREILLSIAQRASKQLVKHE